MTNPTSNFGWQMPTPTDLVTDLPADFEVFGQAVDTSMADLKGGTTGQILSKATNADMDFTWITNDVGDITAVTVSSPLTGGGTSGSVSVGILSGTTSNLGAVQLSDSTSSTSTTLAATANAVKTSYDLANAAIAKSTVTTAGDIIYRNATVPARLGIGTAGQVLAVNSGATAPEWIAAPSGGGMTQLGSTTTLSGSSTLISSISGAYQKLFVEIIDFYMSANASLIVRFNSDATANAYQQVADYYSAAVVTAQQAPYLDKLTGMYATYGSVLNSDNNNYACFELPNYSSSMKKNYVNQSNYLNAGSNNTVDFTRGAWFDTAAISSLLFVASSGTFSGGTVKVWGVK
jgi:hypothetical protein